MSELMKKIFGQLVDPSDDNLTGFPLNVTVELMKDLESDNPGGWIGAAPVKTSGSFELFTTYDMGVSESVSYRIFHEGVQLTEGSATVTDFDVRLEIEDSVYEELLSSVNIGSDEEIVDKVTGMVSNLNGRPVAGSITVYEVTLLGQEAIGTADCPASGYYEYVFTDDVPKAFQVEFSYSGADPVLSDVMYNASGAVSVNLTVPVESSATGIQSEFELLYTALTDASGADLGTVGIDRSAYLAGITGENEELVKMLLLSLAYTEKITTDIMAFYGIMRTSMQTALEVLVNMSREDLENALKQAVSLNIVSHMELSYIQGYVTDIKSGAKDILLDTPTLPVTESKGVRILGNALSGEKLSSFLDYYYNNDISDPDFWSVTSLRAAVSDITDTEIEQTKAVVVYAVMTGNNPAMVTGLMSKTMDEIVSYSKADWTDRISEVRAEADFVYPEDISIYETEDERKELYSTNLRNNFSEGYRSTAVKHAVVSDSSDNFPTLKDNLNAFVAENPAFDLLRTPSNKIAELFPSDYATEAFIEEVATVQRLNVIAPSFEAVVAIRELGVNSASEVVRMSRNDYVTALSANPSITTAAATLSYSNAVNTVIASQAVALAAYSMVSLTIPSIYPADPVAEADLRSLFGTVDYCSCSECSSVFSASAYLVDSLELLRQNDEDAYDQLRARRPDLWDVKLTCRNTNTALPYIDLANEVLEDMVRAAGTDASSSGPENYPIKAYNTGADDLGKEIPGVDEKTLDAIPEHIDQVSGSTPLAYAKLKNAPYPWTAPYNFFKEQIKEHLNLIDIAAYKLPQTFLSKQDWIGMFDTDTACAYLGITKSAVDYYCEYNIIKDDFSGTVGGDSPTVRLRKYYGINDSRTIQVAAGTNPPYIVNPANRAQYIIIPAASSLVAVENIYEQAASGSYQLIASPYTTLFMSRIDILMQQTGLGILDIFELLDCNYINPVTGTTGATVQRALKIDGDPQTTCDTSKLYIDNLTEAHLKSIHRFIRLQRKTGWSKQELDRVFTTFSIAAGENITDEILVAIAQLKRLTEVLKCPVTDILPFFGDFGYLPYNQYGSAEQPERVLLTQYEQIFRNPSSDIAQLADYPFPLNQDMMNWKELNPLFSAPATSVQNTKYLLGALQVSEKDFNFLFDFYNEPGSSLNGILVSAYDAVAQADTLAFTYQNALNLYCEFKLCRLLNLSVSDYCFYRSCLADISEIPFINVSLTSIPIPFVFTFIEGLNALRNSGLSPDALNYIFRDKCMSSALYEQKKKALYTQVQSLRSGLAKLSVVLPDGSTIDGKALQTKLEAVMNADDADFMVNTVGSLSLAEFDSPSATYTFTTEQVDRFESLIPSGTSSVLVTGSFNESTDINLRLKHIDDIFNELILKPQVKNSLSTANKTDLSITELLLENIYSGADDAYRVLLNQAFIDSTGDLDPDNNAEQEDVLIVVEKLMKASLLVQAYKFSLDEVDFIMERYSYLSIPDIADLPVGMAWSGSTTGLFDFADVVNLQEWVAVRKRMNPSPTGIFPLLKSVLDLDSGATADQRKEAWFDAFVLAVQIGASDLEVLVGARNSAADTGELGFDFSGTVDTFNPLRYKKILDCFDMVAELEANMQTCYDMTASVVTPDDQGSADIVVQTIKARYGKADWLEQVKPVNDRLRIGRRDGMVAYLLAFPPNKYRAEWLTSNDIYETLLIDTEMMPIVKTSRIKQAIGSIQIFIDRCLLQQEKKINSTQNIVLDVETRTQWNLWRKWYRIWEANRRIFVYPENWIEPELRDDKSPFFKDVEKFIKQNDVNADTMAEAYRNYLESLEEVSHMDIVSYYTESVPNDVIVHVWGRTKADPHMYYYRKRVQKVWTAWEKMDTQVDGNNFVAVKWRGRLRLYWLNVTEKTVKKQSPTIRIERQSRPPEKYLEIKVCWTELNNGKWQAKKIGKEWLESVSWSTSSTGDILYNGIKLSSWAIDYGRFYTEKAYEDSLENYIRSLRPYCKINADDDLEIVVLGKKRYVKLKPFSDQNLMGFRDEWSATVAIAKVRYIMLNGSLNGFNEDSEWFPFIDEEAFGYRLEKTELWFNNYYFSNNYKNCFYEVVSAGVFTVKQNKVLAKSSANNISSRFLNLMNSGTYFPTDSQYRYVRNPDGYVHTDSSLLLGHAPAFTNAPTPDKFVVLNGLGTAVDFPRFFYNDYNSSFYVEKVSGINLNLVLGGSNSALSNAVSTKILTHTNLDSADGFLFTTKGGTAAMPAQSSAVEMMLPDAPLRSKYRFYPFNYYKVEDIMTQLDINGVEGLFDWEFTQQMQLDDLTFETTYQPTANVVHYYPEATVSDETQAYPMSGLDFRRESPTAIYNWELFFHIPLLIANKLMQDQQFDEALKWFHYVFNPTNPPNPTNPATVPPPPYTPHGDGSQRFWQFLPFHKESSAGIRSIQQIMEDNSTLADAVSQWANDPFKPHLVARTRVSAYMRNVVMKYLDNLINWGDQLFRRDTMESINEATLLYILAAQILGRPPVKVPKRFSSNPKSYEELAALQLNAFSNAAVQVQTIMAPAGVSQTYTPSTTSPNGTLPFYFDIPANSKLLSYWDVVADRLFKIRNSQNIDGIERQLALFEPPIDPALLVRAAAAGVSLSDAVNGFFTPMPQYRYNVFQQKAMEMVQEVKSLGGSLLSAIEKRDAEQIALLRSSQEMDVMDRMREVKQLQLQESQTQILALQYQQDSATTRRDYYSGLLDGGLNEYEQSQIDSLKLSIPLKIAEGSARTLSGGLFTLPDGKIASPFSAGFTFGGTNFGNSASAAATALGVIATVNDIKGTMAGIRGGYERRKADWNLQLKLADTELKQIEKQLMAAEIRASLAEREVEIQDVQLTNAVNMDAAMHDKYSNEELYDWMIGELSGTYFESYKLAYDLAKRAEKCYNYELGTAASFVKFGHWDSLKKGLLAGEGLSYDLKLMDASYLEMNKRQHELTKHVSLAMLDPQELLKLKSGEKATINIPEWLFDMDYPGHYFRRIKSVSISIPCVAGPYSTVSAKLTLNNSQYRKSAVVSGSYGDSSNYEIATGGTQSIATSTAQNDSGMFEMNFRDERYLPFEGAGVDSSWTLELPAPYASFDKSSISDVVIHINYTAKYDGKLAISAKSALNDFISDVTTNVPLVRYFSLKHEFGEEWYKGFENPVVTTGSDENGTSIELPLYEGLFPEYCKGRPIMMSENDSLAVFVQFKEEQTAAYSVIFNDTSSETTYALAYLAGSNNRLAMASLELSDVYQIPENMPLSNMKLVLYKNGSSTPIAASEIVDVYIVVNYALTAAG